MVVWLAGWVKCETKERNQIMMSTNERRIVLELTRLSGKIITVATDVVYQMPKTEERESAKKGIDEAMEMFRTVAQLMESAWGDTNE
jgi:hypothetical protein